jgi:hypothetical protein
MGFKSRTPTTPPKPALDESLIKECEDALEKLMDELSEDDLPFEAYERKLLEIVHEIARRKLERKLQTVADAFAPRLLIDHLVDQHASRDDDTVTEFRRHCPGAATYHSLVGPLRVRRGTYRERGATTSCVPLELATGLIERMTPALARCVAIGYAHMPLRTCEELMVAGCLRPPSRSTLDRTARDLGAYAVACNAEIEPQVRANELLPASTVQLALGIDRVAVPMRHGEEHEGIWAYRPAMRHSRPRPKARARIRGPVQWRMDYVGTVAFLDDNKQLLASRKYRVPADADVSTIVARVMADLRHALVQRPVEIAVIQDGAPELWSAMKSALGTEPLVHGWTEVLDWYHLDEHLSKCLDVCASAAEREVQRARWHQALLETNGGADDVIRELRDAASEADADGAKQLATHLGYFERNRQRMNYAACRERAIPIGSGVTEGACKSIVNVRAKRSGQRWSQRGISAALHLRTVHNSDRFDSFWSFFAGRYRAKHIVPVGFDSTYRAY